MDPKQDAKLAQLALDAWSGDAVLFLGSGFSRGATNAKFNTPMPTAAELAKILETACALSDTGHKLEAVAEHFVAQPGKGKPELYRILREQFVVARAPADHEGFISIPWFRIYTTNYDNLAEQCVAQKGRQAVTLDLDHDPHKPIPQESIIHLNGSVLTANSQNVQEKIRLTEATYWDDRIKNSGWLDRFWRDISNCRALVFVGYSLPDLDFAKIMRLIPDLYRKTYFIDSTRRDAVKETRLSRVGFMLPLGFEFIAKYLQAKEGDARATRLPEQFNSFEQLTAPSSPVALAVDSVRDFYIAGRNSLDLSFLPTQAQKEYFCPRSGISKFLELLDSGTARFVVIAKSGNGKTVFCQNMAAALVGRGYDVFSYRGKTETLQREIDAIKARKSAVIVENFLSTRDESRFLSENLGPDVPVICTCRTALYDLRSKDIDQVLGRRWFPYLLDGLSEDERNVLGAALQKLGFLGRYSSGSTRIPRLLLDWGNDIRSAVLKLFEDAEVGQRIRSEFNEARKRRPELADALTTSCLVALTGFRADSETVDGLLGEGAFDLAREEAEYLGDLLEMSPSRIEMRSPVLAEYCLRKVFTARETVTLLVKIARMQSEQYRLPLDRWQIMKQFTRYGFLAEFLPSSERDAQIRRYYNALREITRYQRDPHFWLQFAVSEMNGRDRNYELARQHLDTARSWALKKDVNYDMGFIDNHFARYLLQSRAKSRIDYGDYYVSFLKASGTALKEASSKEGTTYYTARIVKCFAEFFDRAGSKLNADEVRSCVKRLKTIQDLISSKVNAGVAGQVQYGLALESIDQSLRILNGEKGLPIISADDADFTIDEYLDD